jgi:hypothetical protein
MLLDFIRDKNNNILIKNNCTFEIAILNNSLNRLLEKQLRTLAIEHNQLYYS